MARSPPCPKASRATPALPGWASVVSSVRVPEAQRSLHCPMPVQRSAAQCSAVQRSATQCNAVQRQNATAGRHRQRGEADGHRTKALHWLNSNNFSSCSCKELRNNRAASWRGLFERVGCPDPDAESQPFVLPLSDNLSLRALQAQSPQGPKAPRPQGPKAPRPQVPKANVATPSLCLRAGHGVPAGRQSCTRWLGVWQASGLRHLGT